MQHRQFGKILDPDASAELFQILAEPPPHFRRELIRAGLRFARRRSCEGLNRLYLNIGHTGLNDPRYRKWLRRAGVRPVYFVHDLIPITHPEFCREGEGQKHQERILTVLNSAIGIICNSQVTLRNLASFAAREQAPCPPAIAALLGSDGLTSTFRTGSRHASSDGRPTFVTLGTIEARKNHLLLLHVWSRLVQRFGAETPHLLVIGQRGWESEQVFDLLDRSELLRSAVTEIGNCDDDALMDYLTNSRALLFPSLIEGYGLPLVEALKAGAPAIASDLPVFREIAGDIPDYLDPLDGPAWERAIMSYAQAGSRPRHEQMQRLASYEAPSWGAHFDKVEAWLAEL